MQSTLSWRMAFPEHGHAAEIELPSGSKRIMVHFVNAVKHDRRFKARLVAGGPLAEIAIDSVYDLERDVLERDVLSPLPNATILRHVLLTLGKHIWKAIPKSVYTSRGDMNLVPLEWQDILFFSSEPSTAFEITWITVVGTFVGRAKSDSFFNERKRIHDWSSILKHLCLRRRSKHLII